ncbi:MAG: phosphoribosylformylglycinamidine synthase subunit PurQ [Bacteroidota bacterium]|nr:phosphoribosylformylglycinamidine synthase subunit PurQ [Bacteroidota bacterium]
MKCGVVTFPGSNCDADALYVLQHLYGVDAVSLWHKHEDLQDCEVIIIPGGFSYGDYLRSGAIARFSTVMKSVIDHANKGGTVIGICNGFQILTEAGLLPGALLRNENQKFVCKNVYVRVAANSSEIGKRMTEGEVLKIPIAHAEGRYFTDEDTLKSLQDNQQILFQYCSEAGSVSEDYNANGSLHHIAGISNKQGNVIGMMPHPERACDVRLKNIDGKVFFDALLYKDLA